MNPRHVASTTLGSLAVHAAGVGVLLWLAGLKHDRIAPRVSVVEVQFTAPPRVEPPRVEPARAPQVNQPTPPPSAPPQQEQAASRSVVRTATPTLAHATVRHQADPSSEPTTASPTPEPANTIEPPPGPSPPPTRVLTAPPAPGPVSAADLYRNVDGLSSQVAANGAIDLGRPGGAARPTRDLFGRPHSSDPVEQARTAALEPTTTALAQSNHTVAAGTLRHDRTAARRAEEAFNVVSEVPNLAAAIRRAPTYTPPAAQPSTARAVGAGDALDAAHASSYSSVTFAPQGPGSYRVLRAEVEVDQDPTGAIVNAHVVSSSHVAAFDAAAVSAIREALPQAPSMSIPTGRRSRWAFEVSEATAAGVEAILGGNEGWRVLSSENNGMRLRMRVRMVQARALSPGT